MITTVPKDLIDKLLHDQIDSTRYATRQTIDIIKLLNTADKKIIGKILKQPDPSSWTAKRLNALLTDIKQTVDDAYWNAEKQLHEQMHGYVLHSADTAADILASQLPVAFSLTKLSDKQLTAIIDTTPISIGPDKKLLLEEIFSKIAAGKEEAIRGAIRLGMVEGESLSEMVRRLQGSRSAKYSDGIFEKHAQEAEKIVRTVVTHTNNQARQATYAANADVLNGWIYISTFDSRTCPVCFVQSGKTFDLGEGPLPPQHINCRCSTAPAVKSWRQLGVDLEEFPPAMRATASGPVRADMSFNDWLKTQPESTQVELLGKTRAGMFASGDLSLDKFTDSSGKMYTLEQLKDMK